MKIGDILTKDTVKVDLEKTDKSGVVGELVDLLVSADKVPGKDKKKVIGVILEREELGSTGIGQGIAIPHGKCGYVRDLVIALGISRKGIDFDSLDGEPVYIVFLLLATTSSAGPHLKALAHISRLLKDEFFRQTLKNCQDAKQVLDSIKKEEERRYS